MTTATFWLIAGVVLLALEMFGVPGIGLAFAGLAALLVGVFVQLGVLTQEQPMLQWAVFFAATALWALALWKPLKKLREKKSSYSNMVGEEAVVESETLTTEGGEVRWSGTVMQAKLEGGALPRGAKVLIRGVAGATLIVYPK